jgi:hypothetical protein
MHKNKLHKLTAMMVLMAISWLFFNSTINRHFHVLENGQIISHSHPFHHDKHNPLPFENHQHADSELFKYDQLSNMVFILLVVLAVFSIKVDVRIQKHIFIHNPLISNDLLDNVPGRSPPSFA